MMRELNLQIAVTFLLVQSCIGLSGSRDGKWLGPDIDWWPRGHFNCWYNGGKLISCGVHFAVNIGVASVNVDTEIDSGGDISGGVGGKVNVNGVEVGANAAVDKLRQVSGGGSVGYGLGPMGVDVHVKGGPDGASVGVGARAGYGPASCYLSADVNDRGVASGDIRCGLGMDMDMGPASVHAVLYVDLQGRVSFDLQYSWMKTGSGSGNTS